MLRPTGDGSRGPGYDGSVVFDVLLSLFNKETLDQLNTRRMLGANKGPLHRDTYSSVLHIIFKGMKDVCDDRLRENRAEIMARCREAAGEEGEGDVPRKVVLALDGAWTNR